MLDRVKRAGWLPVRSKPAALRAVRATLVMAGTFAIADRVIGNLQMATFAAFGSFATLVLASFSGTWREKLAAHAVLAVAGSALVAIGTAVTGNTALAAAVTVPVTFAVFFSGVAGPNAASGATGALLAYVLPAASPGNTSMIPDRLAGWWLASAAGTIAVLAISPRRAANPLRARLSGLARLLAGQLDSALAGHGVDRLDGLIAAKHDLLASFNASPYRPLGLAEPDQALANVVELLEWCTSLIADAVREHHDLRRASSEDRDLAAASADGLREVAAVLDGERREVGLALIERRRQASLAAAARLRPQSAMFENDAQIAFHVQAIAVAVIAAGGEALTAEGRAEPRGAQGRERIAAAASRSSRRVSDLLAAAQSHATVRSVWFINSLRVSVALGVAVAVADLSSVQHGFWVVLGTLSVLRTNAASTRSTALQALSGTVVGFIVGAALLSAIGTSATVLWIVLPLAVFVAAYSPGTAPFAVGQAAFTVTIAVIFNILVPVGWRVGLVRVEDVALGCAVSVLFGAMFWPRGVSAVVGDDLADAFRAGASFLEQAVGFTAGLTAAKPDGEPATVLAASRLDDALRGFLAERGAKRIDKQDLWRLVGGTLRLRLTAHAVAELPRDPIQVADAREALEHRTGRIAAWYAHLAEVLGRPHGHAPTSLEPPRFGAEDMVLASSGSHYGVWLCEHLDHLAEHFDELVHPALRLAQMRRLPWWR